MHGHAPFERARFRPASLPLHHHTVLVVLVVFLYLAIPWWSNIHRGSLAAYSCLDNRQSLSGSLVSGISSLDVPNVGFQGVASTSNAHLGKVSNSVLSLDVT